MTIRDYATAAGVSYEAIRKQLAVYETELAGHVDRTGRAAELDQYAIDFLDTHRAGNPAIVEAARERMELETLRANDTAQKALIVQQAEEIAQQARELAALREKLDAVKDKQLEDSQIYIKKLEDSQRELQAGIVERLTALEAAQKKGLFARLFG